MALKSHLERIATRNATFNDLFEEAQRRHLVIPVYETENGEVKSVQSLTNSELMEAIYKHWNNA